MFLGRCLVSWQIRNVWQWPQMPSPLEDDTVGFKKAYEDMEISLHLMSVNVILASSLEPLECLAMNLKI